MKYIALSGIISLLLTSMVGAMDIDNLEQTLMGQEVPQEIIFVSDNDIINIYAKSTGSFIFGVQLENRQVKSILDREEKGQMQVYVTLEALDEISSTKDYRQKSLEHYQKENIIIEPKTFTGQIKYKIFLLLNTLR